MIAVEIPDLPDERSGAVYLSHAVWPDDAPASFGLIIVAECDEAATAGAWSGMHTLQRPEDCRIAQEMWNGIVGREDG